MKQLYDDLSIKVSALVTRTYSTSFTLGIYFLNSQLRDPIYAIYGFVRLADEIVDSFDGYDQETLLKDFKKETFEAIDKKISINPVLNAFQHVVHQYQIKPDLIESFLKSMEMDLHKTIYTSGKYKKYIHGSAEVVGLMCLHVFTGNNKKKYDELKPYAMKLGAAFQKVNFLRDISHDFHILGRTYFPNIDFINFSNHTKNKIEKEIEVDFNIALEGIKKLPASSKGGVYHAYVYYRSLFNKIKKTPSQQVFSKRIRIHNGKKMGLMLSSMMQHKMNML